MHASDPRQPTTWLSAEAHPANRAKPRPLCHLPACPHGSSRPRIVCHCPHSVCHGGSRHGRTRRFPRLPMRCDATAEQTWTHPPTPTVPSVPSHPLPSISLACPVLCRQRPSCTLPVLCLLVGLINFASRLSGFNVSGGLNPIRNRNLLSIRPSAPMPNPSDLVPASARLSTLTAGILGILAIDSIPSLGSCFFDRPCLVRPNAHWALVGVYHRPTATSRHGFPLRHAAQAPQTMTCSSTLASVEARLKKVKL